MTTSTSPHERTPDPGWKPAPGRDHAAIDAEQDKAAGGRQRRMVLLDDGTLSVGTIVLKALRNGRVHAYLRWRTERGPISRSVGQVDKTNRSANLIDGWNQARAFGLLADVPVATDSWASSPAVRASMKGNRGKDTRPELRLRRLLHARGFRYRVASRPLPHLPRTADLVFRSARVAVFVDGCFWHGCPQHHRPARKNAEFWEAKIAANRGRDATTNQALAESGWTVIRCWEHDDLKEVADRIGGILRSKMSDDH